MLIVEPHFKNDETIRVREHKLISQKQNYKDRREV